MNAVENNGRNLEQVKKQIFDFSGAARKKVGILLSYIQLPSQISLIFCT